MKDIYHNVKAFYKGNETRIIASVLFAALFVALLLCLVGCAPGKTEIKVSGTKEKVKGSLSYQVKQY